MCDTETAKEKKIPPEYGADWSVRLKWARRYFPSVPVLHSTKRQQPSVNNNLSKAGAGIVLFCSSNTSMNQIALVFRYFVH